MIVGIDIGRTKSCIAAINTFGVAELISRNMSVMQKTKNSLVPSVIHIDEDFVYVGEMAQLLLHKKPELPVVGLTKNHLGNNDVVYQTEAGETWYGNELIAIMLRKLKLDAEASESTELAQAICCIPNDYDAKKRDALYQSFTWSHFSKVYFLENALAIAHGYQLPDLKMPTRNILVIDCGSEELELAIVQEKEKGFELLDTSVFSEIGGNYCTQKISEFIIQKYELATLKSVEVNLKTQHYINDLAEKIKINFSESFIKYQEFICALNGQSVIIQMSRLELNELLLPILKIQEYLDEFFFKSSLKSSDIDCVLLAGGTCAMPVFQNQIRDYFDFSPPDIYCNHLRTIAVKGATIFADRKKDHHEAQAEPSGIQMKNTSRKRLKIVLGKNKQKEESISKINKVIINNIV